MSENPEKQLDDDQNFFEEEHLQDYLERATNTLGISSPKFRISSGSKKGDNYVGIIYRVFIEGKRDNVPVKIQTIVKVPPKDEIKRQILSVPFFFPREHLFYTEILPMFDEFLKTKNKRIENVAECYFSSAVSRKEVIFLEDLQSKGFKMMNGMKQFDFAHALLAFRALGRLHALSFALRDQRPEVFNNRITTLKETMLRPEVCEDERFIAPYEKFANLITMSLVEEDSMYTERWSEFLRDIPTILKRSCDGSLAEPYAVLAHGDYRASNLLFKYAENSDEPQEVCLLDFQIVRYASPASDISYALFCNCSQELRAKHYDELIRIYHESLSTYLLELGSDSEKLFPFDALMDQLAKHSIYGAVMSPLVIPWILHQDDDAPEMHGDDRDLNHVERRMQTDDYLTKTMKETCKDLIDRNYI